MPVASLAKSTAPRERGHVAEPQRVGLRTLAPPRARRRARPTAASPIVTPRPYCVTSGSGSLRRGPTLKSAGARRASRHRASSRSHRQVPASGSPPAAVPTEPGADRDADRAARPGSTPRAGCGRRSAGARASTLAVGAGRRAAARRVEQLRRRAVDGQEAARRATTRRRRAATRASAHSPSPSAMVNAGARRDPSAC